MPKYIKPLNACALQLLELELEEQYRRLSYRAAPEQQQFLKNCLLIHVNQTGKCPADRSVLRWLAADHSPTGWGMWAFIAKILKYHGYKAEYPYRLGGQYSTPATHPARHFPAEFDLALTDKQLKWLKDHDWIITKPKATVA